MSVSNGDNFLKETFLQNMQNKILKEPTNIFDECMSGQNLPITGGNVFSTQQYLDAVFGGNSLVKYNLLLDSIRCLRNLYTIENDDMLARSWQNIMTILLIYGAVGIRKKKRINGDLLQLYGIMNFTVDDDLSIKECEGYLPTILNRGINFGFDKNKSKMVKLTNDTAIFATYGTEALSLLIRVNSFINARYRVLKIASGNVMYHNKKIKMKYGGGNSAEMEFMIDSVTNDNSKVIVEFAAELDLTVSSDDEAVIKGKKQPKFGNKHNNVINPTTFEPMIDRSDVNKDVWIDYDKLTDIQNELCGIRFNGAKKKSRNTTDDVKTSNAKTILIEKDLEQSLKYLIYDYNKKYGKNAKLIKTHDEELIKDDINNEKENI